MLFTFTAGTCGQLPHNRLEMRLQKNYNIIVFKRLNVNSVCLGEVMIKLPDFSKTFEYENNFYLSCDTSRMAKIISHYEFFKMTMDVPGAIVECGVFKGASLARFAMFRDLLMNSHAKKIIGFDAFGKFPETKHQADKKFRTRFIKTSGTEGISETQMKAVLQHKCVYKNVDLVKGNVLDTIPRYLKENPELKISLLNLDTDVYEPAKVILSELYPRITRGGIILIDDYGVFPGETQAVDEYFRDKNVRILKLPYSMTPCYIIKD